MHLPSPRFRDCVVLLMSPWNNLPVLVVEDSEDDLFFFKRLCKKAGIAGPLAIATDGQQAVDVLTAALAGAGGATVPHLVFLDLKLPLRSGFEVLEWIRAQPALARTTVVILSSSAEARDVEHAYRSGAQGYLVKYPEPGVLEEVVRKVHAVKPDANLDTLDLPGLKRT
jgi:CheY-like chemotaxis protein